MNIEALPIDELMLDPSNARKHSEKNLNAIKGSLAKFGQQKPIVVDANNVVLAGNGTLAAAKSLGWDKIQVVRTKLKGTEAIAYALADNRSAELAEWEDDVLRKTLDALKNDEFDLDSIGFSDEDLAQWIMEPTKFEAGCDEDEVPEVPKDPTTKPGDLYILGNHRLLCGDSTDILQVERLMAGEKANICFTSPPYNVSKQGFQEAKYKSGFENRTDDEYTEFLCSFTSIAIELCDYVFVNNQSLAGNRFSLIDYQYKFKSLFKDVFVWVKKICPPNITKGAFNTKWEYVYCFSKDNRTRGFPCSWQGKYSNIVETESNTGNEFANEHKAGFPVAFPLWFLEKLEFAKVIYEPFCGTGTTIIACEKTNRKCYGMEIDPHYCDIIVARWEKYTGKKAKTADRSAGE